MNPRLKILCLDPDGGYGGSARSLFFSVKYADREFFQSEVWCKKSGPIVSQYEQIGINCLVEPAMPSASSLPRNSRNIWSYSKKLLEFWESGGFRQKLLHEINTRFDLVHLNHEGLWWLACWLSRHCSKPVTMHIRKSLTPNIFSRWQARGISKSVDELVFITENEKYLFHSLGGRRPGRVIHNISEVPLKRPEYPKIPGGKFRILSLSNYAYSRGVDRILDVASVLARRRQTQFLFVFAGNMDLHGSLPGRIGRIARQGGTLEDYARLLGVENYCEFLGHVSNPSDVIMSCHATIKLSRQNNPWGRDTIESLALGRPVIATGTWDGFIQDGESGYLLPRYSSEAAASVLEKLIVDGSDGLARMGEIGMSRVKVACGSQRAHDLTALWRATISTAR